MLWLCKGRWTPDAKILFKEGFQLFNNSLFFSGSSTTTKAGYRRHKFIYVSSDCSNFAIPKRIFYELSGILWLQLFFLNDNIKVIIPLCHHKFMPLIHDIIHIIDSCNKSFNELFLTAQLWTRINRLIDGYQHFLVFAVCIMILLYKHEDIININFYLPDQFNFKYHIICNICTFLTLAFPLITQILITTEVIL